MMVFKHCRYALWGIIFAISQTAYADNIAQCEVILTETIKGEDGENTAQIASYRPAADFIASAYGSNAEPENLSETVSKSNPLTDSTQDPALNPNSAKITSAEKTPKDNILREIDGYPIRALLCKRSDIIITKTDFKLLATGIPFILSQNFDSAQSDIMTYFFKDGQFQYKHKGRDLSDKQILRLTALLDAFNQDTEAKAAIKAQRAAFNVQPERSQTAENKAGKTNQRSINNAIKDEDKLDKPRHDTQISNKTTKAAITP